MDIDICLLHQKLDFVDFIFGAGGFRIFLLCLVISADDFLPGSFTACLIIEDAVACHVDAHVRGGFVRAFPENLLKNRIQYREDFHVPVIVYRSFPIGLQMIGVDHIYVA